MINSNVFLPKCVWTSTVSVLFFLTGPAFAAPVIQQTTGTITHGSTITITGTGFGSKANAAPLRWDDFEAGTVGQDITGWAIGSTKSEFRPKYAAVGRAGTPGSKSAWQHFERGQYNADIRVDHITKKYYVSGWVKGNTSGTPSRNVKLVSFRGKNLTSPQGRFDQYPENGSGHKYIADCNGTARAQDWSVPNLIISDGGWSRFEAWIDLGTPNGNNGVYKTWKNAIEWGKTLGGTFITSDCSFHEVHIQHYFATDTAADTVANYYWDELYVDTTQARVELGNAATWGESTHREIQIPSAWSTNSITFKVNRGSFSPGQTVYLFAVDANGIPSSGYPVTISSGSGSGSGSGTTISVPTSLRIN